MDANLSPEGDSFYREYTSPEAIAKYTRATAGAGVNSLLEREYKEVYLGALQFLPSEMRCQPLRILEFGCGGGVNPFDPGFVFCRPSFNIQNAVGADFSLVLIAGANKGEPN